MTVSTITTDCCCTGEVYIAFPCWEHRTLLFELNTVSPFTRTFIANGTNTNSNNPPAGTLARLVLIGAGGAGNGIDAGGGGAYLEAQLPLAATTMTFRIGHGGAITNVGATVFGGGAQGASNTRYGGGASAFNLNATTNHLAAGGGGAASANFASVTGQTGRGGDAGVVSSTSPASDVSTAGGATQTVGGAGGLVGGGTGTVGTLPTAGTGGVGAPLVSGQGGGGGGGGGRAAGGGGGTQSVATIYGGAGTGGASFGGDSVQTHRAANGYAQASPYTNLSELRGIGDGGIGVGGAGRGVLAWRACSSCPCPEMPSGLPPALHVCITQQQFNALLSSAGADPCPTASPWIAFKYKGWPFYISRSPSAITGRPCSRLVASSDLTGGRWVATSDYCCALWRLPKATTTAGNCTPDCSGGNCPDYIYLCDEYRHALGLPPCADRADGQCYFVQYNSCDYLFTNDRVDGDCIAPSPVNVGDSWELGDCTQGKPASEWIVGPHVFTGGFQCGLTLGLEWNASGAEWQSATVQPCRQYVGRWVAQYEMNCRYFLEGKDVCYAGVPACVCGEDFDGFCESAVAKPARQYEGLCNTTADPNVCSDPCSCPAWQTWWDGWSGLPILQQFDADSCGLSWSPALTITRNCPHPTSSFWLYVDGPNGVVEIDGCRFIGNGTAEQFAQRINEVLGDRLTAVGDPKYWFGVRWRGTKAYPDDFACDAGYAPLGDDAQVISSTATEQIVAARYSSIWKLRVVPTAYAMTYFEQSINACTCSGSPACWASGWYESNTCAIEMPHVPITPADFSALSLVLDSQYMTCAPDPLSWPCPPTIQVI